MALVAICVLPLIGLLALAIPWLAALLVIGFSIGLLIAVDRELAPAFERWSRGAAGEEAVGAILDEMQATGRWFAVHDVASGRGNVDHILVGPAGVFTVETKSHRGRVDQVDRRMLNRAWAQKKWLEEATGLPAQPLLVFSRAWVERPGRVERGVRVLPARMLRRNLEERPTRFTPEQVRDARARIEEVVTRDAVLVGL